MLKQIVCCLMTLALFTEVVPQAMAQRPEIGKRPARRADTISVGDSAPDFQLKTLDGKVTMQLSRLCVDRPVALVFGSYT